MPSTRCSARPTAASSWARSSTQPATAWPPRLSAVQSEDRRQLRVAGDLFEQPRETLDLHRDRPAPDVPDLGRRVRHPYEPLAGLGLEQLHVRRELAARRLL